MWVVVGKISHTSQYRTVMKTLLTSVCETALVRVLDPLGLCIQNSYVLI